MSNLRKLQETLLSLTYSEMMYFASWFANTELNEEDQYYEAFWASTINDWACNAKLHEDDDTALASTGGEHHAE